MRTMTAEVHLKKENKFVVVILKGLGAKTN
jgi:hypothetical protein